MLAGVFVLAGCSGRSEPRSPTAAPAAPTQSGNAAQGGGVRLENPGQAPIPDGGGIKNP